jgi:hypothetical protein
VVGVFPARCVCLVGFQQLTTAVNLIIALFPTSCIGPHHQSLPTFISSPNSTILKVKRQNTPRATSVCCRPITTTKITPGLCLPAKLVIIEDPRGSAVVLVLPMVGVACST